MDTNKVIAKLEAAYMVAYGQIELRRLLLAQVYVSNGQIDKLAEMLRLAGIGR